MLSKPRELARKYLKPWLGPGVNAAREWLYAARFRAASEKLKLAQGSRVRVVRGVAPEADADELWNRLTAIAPRNVRLRTLDISKDAAGLGGGRYFEKYRETYRNIGSGREKAFEHALTFELFDLRAVRRYCDVASSLSPIARAFDEGFPAIEYWRQDLVFETKPDKRVIGGFAHEMGRNGIEAAFFDLMALHCSFEHFSGDSDQRFIGEVDRVLSSKGACLILPLYIDREPKIFLDPTCGPSQSVGGYDRDALLCASYGYRQEHGRYYSPETLRDRVLGRVPASLEATVIRFTGQERISSEVYLRFALVLHRKQSVLRDSLPFAGT